MIEFYRLPNCSICDQIQEKLEEMVIAHRVVIAASDVPVLVENKKTYRGSSEILEHLSMLKKLKEDWDKFQGDACYCGEDGEVI